MFKSMTAFGRSRKNAGGADISVEIKSVNNRYFDCSVKLPFKYSAIEQKIKPYIRSRGVSRGKIDVYIAVESTQSEAVTVVTDKKYAEAYIKALKELRDEFSLKDDISVMTVAANTEIFKFVKPEEDGEKDWDLIFPVIEEAADRFIAARAAEGKRLDADIGIKIENIKKILSCIGELSGRDIKGYRDKIEERIRDILSDNRVTVDENRLLTECAIAADRLSIDEELVRLGSHIESFGDIRKSIEPAGRKMDFLIQEMNREINTIGSKCQNAEMAIRVVECKSEIEKIREQIQNIE